MNFPANHVIDTRGLRVSFLIGAGLYMAGAALYTMVNKGYYFTIFGSILVSLGQPFIINCPAKVATYWFFDHNVKISVILETICNLINDRFDAYWNGIRVCTSDTGCQVVRFLDRLQKWDILLVLRLIFSLSNCIYFSIHLHEEITSNTTLNWSWTEKNRFEIITEDL